MYITDLSKLHCGKITCIIVALRYGYSHKKKTYNGQLSVCEIFHYLWTFGHLLKVALKLATRFGLLITVHIA